MVENEIHALFQVSCDSSKKKYTGESCADIQQNSSTYMHIPVCISLNCLEKKGEACIIVAGYYYSGDTAVQQQQQQQSAVVKSQAYTKGLVAGGGSQV